MCQLGKELQRTIRHLEAIRDADTTASSDVIEQLDVLYSRQIDLIEANINNNTERYTIAAASLKEAAARTKEALDGVAKLEQAIAKVANAIEKITELLADIS